MTDDELEDGLPPEGLVKRIKRKLTRKQELSEIQHAAQQHYENGRLLDAGDYRRAVDLGRRHERATRKRSLR